MTFDLSVPGVLTDAQVRQTAEAIIADQQPSGMVLWFPGGHADPWNHIEAAMALDLGGFRTEAERAYQWLVDSQRPDGSWHHYYLADGIEDAKYDANVIAYVAAGAWHHYLLTEDTGFLQAMWPVVDRAIEWVLELQTPRGEIRWARHPDGTPWPFALLTGSSSICHSLRCAIAIAEHLGQERPDWELSAARLTHVIRHVPEAFEPKDRWAMDWYYPILGGAVLGEAGRERLRDGWDTFIMEGKGTRCVSSNPWTTAAETCECVMAHLAVGEDAKALDLFRWIQVLRDDDGAYFTGIVYPELQHFPGNERSTYTAAAVVLAADALAQGSPAWRLFVDHSALPELVDTSDPVNDPD
jgi:hypothetical protein